MTAGKLSPSEHEQLELLFGCGDRSHSLDATVDQLRDLFGKKVIFYAGSMVGGTHLERAGYVGCHKGASSLFRNVRLICALTDVKIHQKMQVDAKDYSWKSCKYKDLQTCANG